MLPTSYVPVPVSTLTLHKFIKTKRTCLILTEYGRLPNREFLNKVGDEFFRRYTIGPATNPRRYRIATLGDATYHLVPTPRDKELEQFIYSRYGGHGLKLFVHCLPREFGDWIVEVALLTARSSDYTGYDFTKMAILNAQLKLRCATCVVWCLAPTRPRLPHTQHLTACHAVKNCLI